MSIHNLRDSWCPSESDMGLAEVALERLCSWTANSHRWWRTRSQRPCSRRSPSGRLSPWKATDCHHRKQVQIMASIKYNSLLGNQLIILVTTSKKKSKTSLAIPNAVLLVVDTVSVASEPFPAEPSHWRSPRQPIVQRGHSGNKRGQQEDGGAAGQWHSLKLRQISDLSFKSKRIHIVMIRPANLNVLHPFFNILE